MTTPITWADRERGRRLGGTTCRCGRACYDKRDRLIYCDGCGELLVECYCPTVPGRPEAIP